MTALTERQRRAALHRAASMRDALRRAADVVARDPELRACTSTRDDFAALRAHGHAIDLIEAACERYRARPCLAERGRVARGGALAARFDAITFGELWRRAAALAAALAARGLAAPGEPVAIHGTATIDWVVADLACLYLGAVSLPLQTSLAADDLAHVLDEVRPRCALASVAGLAALGPLAACLEVRAIVAIDEHHATAEVAAQRIAALRARRPDLVVEPLSELVGAGAPPLALHRVTVGDPLVTLSYTSGSTGRPKGVRYPDQRWLQRMREALGDAPLPHVVVCYLPLAQMGGRLTVLRALVSGGLTCFAATPDLSTLLDDVRLARPTQLMLIPRVSNVIYQAYQRRVRAEGDAAEPAIVDDMRARFLGDRLCLITTGAAPTAPEVLAFLARCFGASVIDAYGATELGMVAVNGHVRPDVEYKLADVPELGYTTRDQPYPRGELLVRTPYRAPGLPEDADGYVRSGDIVEERAPRHVVWIDRRTDVVRLSQGEFVGVARLEQLYAVGGPLIAQIYIHANPLRAAVQAVVVPHADAAASERALLDELARIARAHGLKAHEVPRTIVVERTPFSRDNGLLTESDKPRRPALRAAYGAALDALADAVAARQLAELAAADVAHLPVAERVARAAAVALGRDPDGAVDAARSFGELGGDSVTALRFVELVARVCGAAPAVAAVLDPQATLAQLAARLGEPEHGPTLRMLHGDAPGSIRAAQLALARVLGELRPAAPPVREPRVVLLTGATGFLGRVVARELAERGARVVRLVRAPDDAASVVGDLMRPRLGLAEHAYDRLADEVDAIVHCGALVNHVLPYAELFAPNVLGTIEVMRFAVHRRTKPVRFASSIGVAAGLRRAEPIAEEPPARLRAHFSIAARYGLGYSASKWAGEVMLAELAEHAGVPVQIFRCGMLLAHRRDARLINHADLFSRLLVGLARSGVAPPSFYAGEPAGFDGLPVDLVAAAIAAAPVEPGLAVYHASAGTAGASLDQIAGWIADAGVPLRRAESHAAWFAALDPWPGVERWAQPIDAADAPRLATDRFRALVGEPELPAIDAAFVRRCLAALDLLP